MHSFFSLLDSPCLTPARTETRDDGGGARKGVSIMVPTSIEVLIRGLP
jgi:hypothetical protein